MERLLYISQGKNHASHINNIQQMLDSGCKWIQLRLKDISPSEILPTAEKIKRICDASGADLTINDHAEVARDIEAYGLHLGLKDMPVAEARKICGDKIKIGGTVNTIEDVKKRIGERVDYLGLGPLHFTQTKESLSHILGHKGIIEVMDFIRNNQYHIPVIVVGGVNKSDISSLIKAGVYGIGVSSFLTSSNFPQELVIKIKKDIDEAIKNR